MPKDSLSVQQSVTGGLNATYTAASVNGHAFDNSGRDVLLHVKNGGAGASVITFETGLTVDGLTVQDPTVSIPAGEERFFGPFPTSYHNNDGDNNITQAIWFTFDVLTSVTVAAIKA